MAEKIITLSGAATDVLYALFYRGALLSGDLPSKSGAAELRELGFAETRHTATEYQKENHFTFLTAEGQKFAVEYLVNTQFGKERQKEYCCSINLGVDTSNVQKMLDEFNERLNNIVGFKIDRSGKVLINDAFIGGEIYASELEAPQSVTNIYNINLGVSRNKSEKADFGDNGIDIHVNVEDLLRNALAAHEEIERLRKAGDVANKVAADTKAMDELAGHVRKVIMQECCPGGVIRSLFSR
ncbi:Fur-regulated protein [Citrobacter farmeri]|uniref:Fur-regulated protein n=1 Tax=Citrobacter farmeri TaxID=67824 RepID=UPI0019022DA3|nr:Fur-regulated protein [Citrobacter farmeri]MBJ9137927.1 Fur-regulated protein [Citrobacter farmeri]